MDSSRFPLGEHDRGALSKQDFIEWLTPANSSGLDVSSVLALGISSHKRSLKSDEGAALLKAVDSLSQAPKMIDSSVAFIVVGTLQPDEHLLADAIASGIGLHVTHDILPSARLTSSLPRTIPHLVEELVASTSHEEATTNQDVGLHFHALTSLRNKLIEAIHLSATVEPMWQAVSVLLEVPRRSNARFVCVDIKIGDQYPALPYEQGWELAKNLLKIAYLADIRSNVILSDATTSASLAFGPLAKLQDLARVLKGQHEPPYTSISAELVAELLSLIAPGTYAHEARQRAYETLHSGAAQAAILRWNVSTLKEWITQTEEVKAQYQLSTTSSGYLQNINSSLIRTALEAANREKEDTIHGEDYSILILRNVGEKINKGDDLARISGTPPPQIRQRLVNAILKACYIGSQRPQEFSIIRAHITLETVLIRKHFIAIIPIKMISNGKYVIYALLGEENTPIELVTQPYNRQSKTDDTPYTVYQLAARFFSPNATFEIKKTIEFAPETFAYDPEADTLLSPRYYVFVLSVIDDGLHTGRYERANTIGKWFSLDKIEEMDDGTLGPALRAVKNIMKNLVN